MELRSRVQPLTTYIDELSQPLRSAPTAAPHSVVQGARERLERLDLLFADGVISAEEHAAQRAAIIRDL